MDTPLVEFRDLKVHFPVYKSFIQRLFGGGDLRVHAVDGVSLSIREGEIFGIVGESGCGKSTIARTLVGLVRPTGGEFLFHGRGVSFGGGILVRARKRFRRAFRLQKKSGSQESRIARPPPQVAGTAAGRVPLPNEDRAAPEPWTLFRLREQIQMIHQDPHAALSPAMTVGQAIADVVRTHGIPTESGERVRASSEQQVRDTVYRALEDVELRPPSFYYTKYPDELSGGQKQRVVVGRVLVLRPKVVVADEPLAMLDMSVRARMLEFLLALKARFGLTYVFITHDLATAKFVCDRIAIMYLGRIVEAGPAKTIYADPKHPYTRALLEAIPVPDPTKRGRTSVARGEVPDAIFPPAGCRFHPRCPVAMPNCGWEGRDFINLLEERWLDASRAATEWTAGPLELWTSDGTVASRPLKGSEAATVLETIRVILSESPPAFARAVQRVALEGDLIVIRFRPPDALVPKEVEGRSVECLLY